MSWGSRCGSCDMYARIPEDVAKADVLLDPDLWPEGYPCFQWWCSGMAQVYAGDKFPPGRTVRFTVDDYFRAIHGLGLPTERNPPLHAVTKLISEQQVEDVEIRANPDKSVTVTKIGFDSHTLHLAGSPEVGAVIFKMTRNEQGAP